MKKIKKVIRELTKVFTLLLSLILPKSNVTPGLTLSAHFPKPTPPTFSICAQILKPIIPIYVCITHPSK